MDPNRWLNGVQWFQSKPPTKGYLIKDPRYMRLKMPWHRDVIEVVLQTLQRSYVLKYQSDHAGANPSLSTTATTSLAMVRQQASTKVPPLVLGENWDTSSHSHCTSGYREGQFSTCHGMGGRAMSTPLINPWLIDMGLPTSKWIFHFCATGFILSRWVPLSGTKLRWAAAISWSQACAAF